MSGGEIRKLWAGAVLYGLVAMFLVIMSAALYFLVENAQSGAATRKLLIECVVPPQDRTPPIKVTDDAVDCYTRSQKQQGTAVQSLSQVSIIAAACGAAHPGDVVATQMCVTKELAKS